MGPARGLKETSDFRDGLSAPLARTGAVRVGYWHWGQKVRGVPGLSAPEKSHFTVVLLKRKVTQKIYDEQNAQILNKGKISLEGLFSLFWAPLWLVIARISSLVKILFYFLSWSFCLSVVLSCGRIYITQT